MQVGRTGGSLVKIFPDKVRAEMAAGQQMKWYRGSMAWLLSSSTDNGYAVDRADYINRRWNTNAWSNICCESGPPRNSSCSNLDGLL